MSAIEYVKPRVYADVPAFLAGALFAYEDLLGAFSATIVVRPTWGAAPLNTLALTSERLIAYDVHGATEATAAIPMSAITGISSPDDAALGRLRAIAADMELHITDLTPQDAAFVQDVVYNAAAGRLYRAGQSEHAE